MSFSRPRGSFHHKGFTLIETLVVVAITSLLASLILTYSSNSRDQVALYVEKAKITQVVSRAKALTIATFNRPEVPCGYGVSVDYNAATYTLFSYDAANCDVSLSLDPTQKTVINSYALPKNLKFSPTGANSLQDVLFLPPEPKTQIWKVGSIAISESGEIKIQTGKGDSFATIKVSSAGQITF